MKKKVALHNLGCKVNSYELEAMQQLLEQAGYEIVPFEPGADVYVINTCTVTNIADRKSRQMLHKAKKMNPDAVVVATGCYVQTDEGKLEKDEAVDLVLGNNQKKNIVEVLTDFEKEHQRQAHIIKINQTKEYEELEISRTAEHVRAYIKVQDGCNQFCTYCIIPYARGRVRSREKENILNEVHKLAKVGYKEVVLTGINLSAYGQEFGLHLCDAIEAACATPGIERVRLGSLEPEQLSEDVIRRMAKQKKLCPQFHLSLQSGCDATLKRMNRHYTADEYRTIVRNLRAAFENAAITTDIMVGFAGETDEEFAESLAFAEEIAFAKVHVFAYSRRPGTRAYDMGDQLTNAVKEARSHEMIRVTTATQQAFFKAQIGRTEEVLFEREIQKGVWEGYSMNYTPVAVASGTSLAGEIRSVRIESCTDTHCMGAVL